MFLNKCKFKLVSAAVYEAHTSRAIKVNYYPPEIFIEPTNHCNLKCVFCPQHKGLTREKGFMDWDLYKKIIDEVKNKAQQVSLFVGGESLLHKDIFKMIEYASSAKLKTRLHSNGALLTENGSRLLIEAGLSELSFSFDGPNKERYETTRIGGSYEKTLRNIKSFLEIKRKLNSKIYTIIQVVSLPGEDENKLIEELNNLFEIKPDLFNITPVHSYAGVYECFLRGKQTLGHDEYYFPCSLIYNRVSIGWNGDMLGCCMDMNGKYIIGNVKEQRIIDLWNNEKMLFLRKALVEKRYKEIEMCRACADLWLGNPEKSAGWKRRMLGALIKVLKPNKWFGLRSPL